MVHLSKEQKEQVAIELCTRDGSAQEIADKCKVSRYSVYNWAWDLLGKGNVSPIKKIKEVAASLLKKIKAKIAELDHWTDKQETKAAVDNLIRDTLRAELPECYDEISISEYRQRIYEYVYTRYRVAA